MQQFGFTLQNYTPEEKLHCPKDYLLYSIPDLGDSLHHYNQILSIKFKPLLMLILLIGVTLKK